jgi:hypothetical protein
VKNSLEISDLALSANLLPKIKEKPELEIVEGPLPLEFDEKGDLVDPLLRLPSSHAEATLTH